MHERDAVVRAARVGDEPGGLVDDEQVLVVVHDLEVELGRRELVFLGELDLDLLAPGEPVALGARKAVDEHCAAGDQALGERAGADLVPRGDQCVEAPAGVRLRSAKAERCQPGRSSGRRRRSRRRGARPPPR